MKNMTGGRAAIVASLALLLLIFAPTPARAQGDDGASAQTEGHPGAGKRLGDRFHDLRLKLNLTPVQIEQIKAVREQNKEEVRAVRQRLRQTQRALDEAIYSDNANEALIEERARGVAEAQTALVRMRALTELKIRRILTPEQLSILRTLRERRTAERERRRLQNGDRPRERRRPRGQRP
jgi:Spy/CpxP family protein refolding chaperone